MIKYTSMNSGERIDMSKKARSVEMNGITYIIRPIPSNKDVAAELKNGMSLKRMKYHVINWHLNKQ